MIEDTIEIRPIADCLRGKWRRRQSLIQTLLVFTLRNFWLTVHNFLSVPGHKPQSSASENCNLLAKRTSKSYAPRTHHKLLGTSGSSSSYSALYLRREPKPPFKSYIIVLGVKVSVPSAPIPGRKWTSWFTGDSSSSLYVKYDSYGDIRRPA